MSKRTGYGPAVQASRGTMAWSDLLYDDKEDRWYLHPSHSVSCDDGPWQWGDGAPPTPVHEGPPGQMLDGMNLSFSGAAFGGRGNGLYPSGNVR